MTGSTFPTRFLARADVLAGGLTAVMLYAEYLGLGVVLGAALPAPGGIALGGLMVVGAVLVNCVLGAALREPLLAGPRAASLSVLIAGMKFSAGQASDPSDRFSVTMAALSTMLIVAAVVQLAGIRPRVRAWLCCTSLAWRKGFVFSTAVGIVVSMGSTQLDGCLRVSPVWTAAVVACSVAAALAWSRWCRAGQGSSQLRRRLAPFSVMVGMTLASAGYYLLVAPASTAGGCAPVGVMGLADGALRALWATNAGFGVAVGAVEWWVWPVLLLLGALLGLVLLFESLTTLRESRDPTPPAVWAMHLKRCALANFASGLLGLGCSSLSLTRSNALVASAGRSGRAVLFHGLALGLMLLFLSQWMAALPQLAVAVALLLLAIQMIDEDTRSSIWRAGYSPQATPTGLRNAWVFWGVVALSLVCGTVLHYQGWGFGGGPLIALLAGTVWTGQRFLSRRRALRRLRHPRG